MTSVYIVWHSHRLTDQDSDDKLIGVYPSREDADAAVSRASKLPGFRESADGFVISQYVVGRDHWTEGFETTAPKP